MNRLQSLLVRRRITLVLLATILVACRGQEPFAPTMISVVGAYSLRTINGGALPWVNPANTSGNKVEIMGVQLHLSADATFRQNWQFRVTSASGVGTSATADYGSYTLLGSTLVLLYSTNSIKATGDFSPDRLTVSDPGGSTFVFVKQP